MEDGELQDVPVPEDTVEYRIYCGTHGEGTVGRDGLAVECNTACRRISDCHVWHYAPFALRPEINGGNLIVFIPPGLYLWLNYASQIVIESHALVFLSSKSDKAIFVVATWCSFLT